MFRNSQLLVRSQVLSAGASVSANLPVALLADYNEPEARTLEHILERRGFRLLKARDGRSAMDLAQRCRPVLIVAALDLPQVSGYELCQKLRQQPDTEKVPFIFISPPGMTPDKHVGHATFASDYVQRPINLSEFENRVQAVLQNRVVRETSPGAGTPARVSGEPVSSRSDPEMPPAAPRPCSFDDTDLQNLELLLMGAQGNAPQVGEPRRAEPLPEPPDAAVPETPAAEVPSRAERIAAGDPQAFQIGTEAAAERLGRIYLEQKEINPEGAVLYRRAYAYVLSSIRRAEQGLPVDAAAGITLSQEIAASLVRGPDLLLLAMDRSAEFSLTQHSVNVAIIGLRIAQSMELQDDRDIRVCLAGLLHDIGTIKLPPKLLSKFAAFTPEERSEMRRRPRYSAEILSKITGCEWLPQIVGQVHERPDGQGYPLGLKGKEIADEAAILRLANVFEASIHHRPYRRAITGYKSLEALTAETGIFPARITRAMIQSFSVYFFNEYVVLNTGEIGKVTNINPENALRPMVKILYAADGERLAEPRTINLARNASLSITRAISPDELPDTG
jgi:HD-GYP domain-containing protein (c-di-GMP phosphodiesterase class II)/DNA-binding response OmpR family regulator